MIHAPLSAGNLAIDAPPSYSSSPPPTSHTLPPFGRPHCQPAASDVIWLLSTTRGSVLFPPVQATSSQFPHSPPFSPQSLRSDEAALIWLFRQIHFATLIAQGHGQNSKIHRRWHWKLSPASANDAVDVATPTTTTTFSTVGRRRRHRRSFIDVCIMWHIQFSVEQMGMGMEIKQQFEFGFWFLIVLDIF